MRLEASNQGQEALPMSLEKEDNRVRDTPLLVPLRVLYTLNTSPQYLLARTRHKVEVVSVPRNENDKHHTSTSERAGNIIPKQRYAKVLLKACLGAICNASPELICDRSRDYSVYVVDPLESLPHDEISGHTSRKSSLDMSSANVVSSSWGEGVSIGMGLMSWCLAEKGSTSSETGDYGDSGYVMGKFVRDRGSDALEIIMSLRETATQTQHQHALSLSSWGLVNASTSRVNSGVPFPSAQRSSPPLTGASSFPALIPSQPSSLFENTEGEHSAQMKKDDTSTNSGPSAPETASSSNQLDNQQTRAKTKKIGRPPGAKTHPEKRARQQAIQTHKEKLERLLNIVKMQNGEEYDKTLIIASECESKVTEETIARERKLLEELQSRPLIVDGPRFTTQPLPRRITAPVAHSPLVKITAPKRKRKTTTQDHAMIPFSNGATNEVAEDSSSSVQSMPNAKKMESQAGRFLSLLSAVLGKVDGSPVADNIACPAPCQEHEKGKEKQTLPPSDTLANALQRLLVHLPSAPAQPDVHSTNALSCSSMTTNVDVTGQRHADTNGSMSRSEPVSYASHPKGSYPPLFKTADESFNSHPERVNWPYNCGGKRSASLKGEVPKVREDAHPVPGGGWARGRNIVPRAKAPTQHGNVSHDGKTIENSSLARPNPLATKATPDKENMPPAKSKRGLKRSFSSADAKENVIISTLPTKKDVKKRKKEDTANSTKPKITNRAMVGSAKNNKTTSGTQAMSPISSPVRNRTLMSPPRSLPVMAMSEPDFLLSRADTFSEESAGPLIAPCVPCSPRTPPSANAEASESLFTPCPKPTSRLDDTLDSIGANLRSHELRERQSSGLEAVESGRSVALSIRHVDTGWDLPPSSPPPPTSPISLDNVLIAEENQMDWDLAMRLQSELDGEMEKSCADGIFEHGGTSINCADTSTPEVGIHTLNSDRPSDQLSTDVFAPDASADDVFSEPGQFDGGVHKSSDGIELDIDELWSSLGPIIAPHAQLDNLGVNTELGFLGLTNDQTLAGTEEQGAMDAIKLAEDLKSLFGGCVV